MFSSVNTCWTLVAAFLVYFMQAGFALCEAGFTRAKNTGNILMKNMMDFCIGTPCYWVIGFGLMFGGTGAAEHQAEADDPVARGADAEVHHVFHQDVARVLGTGKAGFTQGKTRLHEVDQERCHQRPTGVDGTEHNSHTSPQVV